MKTGIPNNWISRATGLRASLRGAAAALTVLLFGFTAMGLWWLNSPRKPGEIGWPHYRAATLGDGLLLPILSGALVIACSQMRKSFPRDKSGTFVTVAGLSGALVGALLQFSWLADDHPQTNWSLPRPHHFAPSGWYHAAFLTVMAGVIAALIADVYRSLKIVCHRDEQWLRRQFSKSVVPFLILCSGWSFCGLVAIDGGKGSSAVSTAGLAILIAVVSAILLLIASRPIKDLSARLVVTSGAGGFAVVYIAERWPAHPISSVIAPSLLGLTALFIANSVRDSRSPELLQCDFVTVLLAIALTIPPSAHPSLVLRNVVIAIPVLPTAGLLRMLWTSDSFRTACQREFIWGVSVLIPIVGYFQHGGTPTAGFASLALFITGAIFGFLVFPYVKEEFSSFMTVEFELGETGPNQERSQQAIRMALRMGALSLAALVFFGMFLFSTISNLGFKYGTNAPLPNGWAYIAIGAVAIAAISLELLTRRSRNNKVLRIACLIYVGCAVIATTAFTIAGLEGFHRRAMIYTIAQLILVFFWQFESLYGNATMREFPTPALWKIACSLSGALIVASCYAYCCTSILYRSGHPVSLTTSFLPLACAIAVSFIVSRASAQALNGFLIDGKPMDNGVAHYRLVGSVFQDAAISAAMVACFVWIPAVCLSHLPVKPHEHRVEVLAILSSFFFFVAPVFVWCVQNNVENARLFAKAANRSDKEPSWNGLLPNSLRHLLESFRTTYWGRLSAESAEMRFSSVLDNHISIQNLMALGLLLSTGAGIFALMASGLVVFKPLFAANSKVRLSGTPPVAGSGGQSGDAG